MSEKQFIWREKNIKSFGQLCDIIEEIIKKPDGQAQEEATLFMRAYHDFSENARENIGYLSGYYGTEDAKRIRSVFKVVHPIFGNAKPTPEEAFAAGMK